ncbi:MAG: lipopolysaccharide biosynthesis protein, partial [Planctomycetota bacterium]
MLSNSLSQAATIILGIIVVRLISKETLGTYRQTVLVYAFLAGIISLQLQNSLYYFLPKLPIDMHRAMLFQTILGTLAIALIPAAIMLFASSTISKPFHNPQLGPLLRIFAMYPFVNGLGLLVPAFMISIDRAVRGATYSFVLSTARIILTAVLFAAGAGLEVVMWGTVAVVGAIALIGTTDMLRLSGGGQVRMQSNLVLEQLHYCWPIWAATIVGTVSVRFDKFLISTFFDPATYAVYTCGAFEVPLIGLITVSVSTAMMPNMVILANEGKRHDALSLWQEGIRKCSLVIFPSFVLFS